MRRTSLALAAALLASPAAGDVAYVTNQSGDSLSVLDLDAGTEVRRIPVPGAPAGVAAAPDGTVYTVSADSKTVRRIDPESAEVLAEVTLDGGPIGIALCGDRAFVSDWYNARIWVLDARTLSVTATLATGSAPAGLDCSADRLASADRDADRVSLFDLATLAPMGGVPVGSRPFGLAFAPDGRLFVANVGSNDVTVIDEGVVTATVPVGERPYGIAFSGGRAWVSNQYADTVSVVDLATLQPVGSVAVGEYPEGIWAASDGRVVVANWFSNTVSLIDPATTTVVAEIETGDGPRAFGRFIHSAD